jgi:hypothetical protein
LTLEDELFALNNDLAVVARDRQRLVGQLQRATEELRMAVEARDRALEERERAFWHLRRVSEVFPVCMDCGTIRDDSEWKQFTQYLVESGVAVSHGLCPVCEDVRMANLDGEEP